MGNLCTTTQRLPDSSRTNPIVFKGESNKIQFEILSSNSVNEKVDVLANAKLQAFSLPITAKGGEKLQQEINNHMAGKETLNAGEVVVTEGGKIHANHVVHVVLPAWRGGSEQETDQFVLGIKNALVEANKLGAKTVAIPALGGAGVGDFPKEKLANGLITAFVAYSKETVEQNIQSVRIFSADQALVKHLQEAAELALPPTKADTESAAHPNQNGTLHPKNPKNHSPLESNDFSAVQDTQSTQSAAKDEPKEHVEAHSTKEQQPKENHYKLEEQKAEGNQKLEDQAAHDHKHEDQAAHDHKHEDQAAHDHKHEDQAAHDHKHEDQAAHDHKHEDQAAHDHKHEDQAAHDHKHEDQAAHDHKHEDQAAHDHKHEDQAVKNEELDVKIQDSANQEVSNDGNAQENQSHEEKAPEGESH